jgi:hypothetical protein
MKRMIPVLALFLFSMFGMMWLANAADPCNPDNLGEKGKLCTNRAPTTCAKKGPCVDGQGNPLIYQVDFSYQVFECVSGQNVADPNCPGMEKKKICRMIFNTVIIPGAPPSTGPALAPCEQLTYCKYLLATDFCVPDIVFTTTTVLYRNVCCN